MASEQEVAYIPLNLSTEDFDGLKYHKSSFNKGIKDSSYIAGVVTSLLNTGLEKDQVSVIMCEIVKSGLIKAE